MDPSLPLPSTSASALRGCRVHRHIYHVRPTVEVTVEGKSIPDQGLGLGQSECQAGFARMPTKELKRILAIETVIRYKNVLERVMKPVQNPKTTPRTIENCSSAISEPRTSGGLISAMYSGESMLRIHLSSTDMTQNAGILTLEHQRRYHQLRVQ